MIVDGVFVVWYDDVVIIRRGFGFLESFSVWEIDWVDLCELFCVVCVIVVWVFNVFGVEKIVFLIIDDEDDEDDDDYDEDDNKVIFYRVFGGDFEF